jgi:hypothetical protein
MQGTALEADLNPGVLLLTSMATLPLSIRNSFKRTFNGFLEIPEELLPDAEIFVFKEQLKFMKAFTKPKTFCSLKIDFAALQQSGEKARVSCSQSGCQEGAS